MRLTADRDRCVGSGVCATFAPDLFDQDQDGRVIVLSMDPTTTGALAEADAAVRRCPVGALKLSQRVSRPTEPLREG